MNTRRLLLTAAACALIAAASASAQAPTVTIQSQTADQVSVFFLNIPWGPQTFEAMANPGDGFYSRRTWPFARVEATGPFRMGDAAFEAGNYAFVFHPNKGEGMALEVLKIAPGEFLIDGNVMTPTPEGESLHREFITFEEVEDVAPALDVQLESGDGGVGFLVHYGNRRLKRMLTVS